MEMKRNSLLSKSMAVTLSVCLFLVGIQSSANAAVKPIDPDCVSLIVQLNWAIDSARAAVFSAGQALSNGDLDGAMDAYDDYDGARSDQWQVSKEIEDKGCF